MEERLVDMVNDYTNNVRVMMDAGAGLHPSTMRSQHMDVILAVASSSFCRLTRDWKHKQME